METTQKVTQMGLDCHRNFSTISGRDGASGRVVFRRRLEHEDRQRVREQLSQLPKVPVILEGSFGWGWISDELTAAGQSPHLASASKVAAWRKARGIAKSNRTDSDLLGELWDQRPHWWEVWLVPPAVRDQRELLRYRMGLVQVQTRLKNQVHAALHRHGIVNRNADLFGAAGRRWLNILVSDEQSPLRPTTRVTIRGTLMLLDQVRRLIAAATRRFRSEVSHSPTAKRLMTLPGVSWILAYAILAEVGEIERFKSPRHLASYSLLTPIANDSGDQSDEAPLGRHVGQVGRRMLKWAFIEAAHGAVRRNGRFKEVFDRRTDGGKRDRNRGYIAVGHELCRLSHVLWSKEVDYTDQPPPRPGSPVEEEKKNTSLKEKDRKRHGSRRTCSRPGTGQPEDPMAAGLGVSLERQASS